MIAKMRQGLAVLMLVFLLVPVAALSVRAAGAEKEEPAAAPAVEPEKPAVMMETSMGNLKIELYPDKAPQTVANFLKYVNDGFFDGVIFHRVIPGFVIQGGGLTDGMDRKRTRAPIQNEADNGLKNEHYTLSMARTGDPHSATSQFFINLRHNNSLDHRSKSQQGWGYAVFGKVVEGMDVVDQIAKVKTTTKGMYQDVPLDPVTITKAYEVKQK